MISKIDEEQKNCPIAHAFLALRISSGPDRPITNVDPRGTCCPLPLDSLTEHHIFVDETCPDDYVATGVKQELGEPVVDYRQVPNFKNLPDYKRREYFPYSQKFFVRCTKINTEKFTLGPITEGIAVGWYKHIRRMFEKRITRSHLPIELRYGLGRVGKYEWAQSFCVGQPPGSLAISKGRKACSEFKFRELLKRGEETNPKIGTPALPYNRCLYLEDELGAEPRCFGLRSEN